MAPPPVTPSPHRFVIKKPASVSRSTLAPEQHPGSSQQFKATPRFTFPTTPQPPATQVLPISTQSATRFTTPARQYEDVIENSSFEEPVHGLIEASGPDLEAEDLRDEYDVSRRDSKRRRLSSSSQFEDADDNLQPLPFLSSPPTARRPISSTASRFLLSSTPLPPSTPLGEHNTQTFLKPPRFRPPDPAEHAQAEPLPDQFSPHRRGQKYIPGGMAAEVRDWLVNLDSAVPIAAGQREDEWMVRIVVDEVRGGGMEGMTLVRGRQAHGDEKEEIVDGLGEVKIILAGEGRSTGLQRGSRAEVGSIVGIKGPVWEIVLDDVKWGVGVDWKVLES